MHFPPAGCALPEHADEPGYRLESHIETHDEAAFRKLAGELRERCAREAGWLGGTFPGDDAALTALAAEPDGTGWRWQTWHLYPGGSPAARWSTPRAGGIHEPEADCSGSPAGWPSARSCQSGFRNDACCNKDIRSYIASHYNEYSRDANGTRYACTDRPRTLPTARRLSGTRGARRQRQEPVPALQRPHRDRRPRRQPPVQHPGRKPETRDTATARSSSSALGSAPDPRRAARAGSPGGPGGTK